MGGTRGAVMLAAQQISFAKLLAANDKKTRDKGLKKLRKYFSSRSEGLQKFTEDDFLRIWKGLYYSMWMSDKPLVQEELAENISSLIHSLKHTSPAVLFIQTFFSTMGIEWYGIDQHRLDKFLMLVRRFLRQALVYCQQKDWNRDLVDKIADMFSATVLSISPTSSGSPRQLGLTLHFIDIFLEELAKVSKGKLDEDTMLKFLEPFLQHVANQDEPRTRSHITKHIFHHLMKQSDMGIEYEEKFAAWRQAGFPGESCEDMVKMKLDEDEQEMSEEELDSDVKDPRAGKVDVVLPQLRFPPETVSTLILQYAQKSPIVKSRKVLYQLADQFSTMAKGSYPLAFQLKVPEGVLSKKKVRRKKDIWKAAEELLQFEESVKEDGDIEDEEVVAEENYLDEDTKPVSKLKRKVNEVGSFADEDLIPLKLKKMKLRLKRCDRDQVKIKTKEQKKGTISDSAPAKFNGDITNKAVVHTKKGSSAEEGLKVLKRKNLNDGAELIGPTKMKKDLVNSTPLKKLRVHLNRWEVTDISSKAKQVSTAGEMKVRNILATGSAAEEEEKRVKSRRLLLNGVSGSAKKVNISLEMNKAQKVSDYVKSVKMSPSIPFDATKRPPQGVLKPSPMASPINPFYKRRSGRKLLK